MNSVRCIRTKLRMYRNNVSIEFTEFNKQKSNKDHIMWLSNWSNVLFDSKATGAFDDKFKLKWPWNCNINK